MSPSLLRQAVAIPNLTRAWDEMAENKGIPGVDQVSVRRWRRNWEERVHQIAEQALGGSYKPRRLRVRRIPKKKPGEFRELRIPTMTDRVLQRAVLQVLHPIFERCFLDCSYGYRPRRGLKDAVERIVVIRVNDYTHVLDADIDDFFNQVDHTLLLDFLRHDLPDESLLNLIQAWLKIGRPDAEEARGIPMGSPLSPLLANVFLHRLDMAVENLGYEMVRYADDFLVFTTTPLQIQRAYREVEAVLARLCLIYEPAKTRLTSFAQGFNFVGVWFQGDVYEYTWLGKRVEVHGEDADWLFGQYGPEYD